MASNFSQEIASGNTWQKGLSRTRDASEPGMFDYNNTDVSSENSESLSIYCS